MQRTFLLLLVLLPFAACATTSDDDHGDDVALPDRDGSTQDVDDAAADGVEPLRDSGASACGQADGGNVICIKPGATFTTTGTLTYGPGFTGPLPAMGFGRRQIGYIPQSDPFTCIATPGLNATTANNTAGGKICDVSFDNTRTGQTTGTATYAVTANVDAGVGDYEVGLVATSGTTILETPFYLRVVQ